MPFFFLQAGKNFEAFADLCKAKIVAAGEVAFTIGKNQKVTVSAANPFSAATGISKFSVILKTPTTPGASSSSPRMHDRGQPSSSCATSPVTLEPSPIIEAYVLPPHNMWPFLTPKVSKQDLTTDRNVLFWRRNATDDKRVAATRDAVFQQRGKIIWIGTPGIGKTAAMDFFLMEALQQLHAGTSPFQRIVVRAGVWAWVVSKSGVSVRVAEYSAETLKEFNALLERLPDGNDTCAIFDLQEDEADPHVPYPMLSSTSSRDAENTFKTVCKTAARFAVVSPWTCEELVAAAVFRTWVTKPAHGQSIASSTELERKLTDEAKVTQERFLQVGGLPRFVLGTKMSFDKRVDDQRPYLSAKSSAFTKPPHVDEFSVSSVPPFAKFLVAPCTNCDHDPFACSEATLVPLSSEAIRVIAEMDISTDPIVRRLLTTGTLGANVAEEIALAALQRRLASRLPQHLQTSAWRLYQDCGSKPLVELKNTSATDLFPPLPEMPYVVRQRFIEADVTTLSADCVYKGETKGGFGVLAVADFVQVLHATRTVRLFQVSLSPPEKHRPISMSALKKLIEKLQIAERKYSVELVYVMEASRFEKGKTRGIRFGDVDVDSSAVHPSSASAHASSSVDGEDTDANKSRSMTFHVADAAKRLQSTTKFSTLVVVANLVPGIMPVLVSASRLSPRNTERFFGFWLLRFQGKAGRTCMRSLH